MTNPTTPHAETPLEGEALISVFESLKAIHGRDLTDTYSADASQATKDRLRMRLAEYAAGPMSVEMAGIVILLRRYFNTYRVRQWRIVEWQCVAALGLLGRVAETVAETQARQERERADAAFRARMARQSERASHLQHGDPRCLTEQTDGECVCV
jgi:hypothetical protein